MSFTCWQFVGDVLYLEVDFLLPEKPFDPKHRKLVLVVPREGETVILDGTAWQVGSVWHSLDTGQIMVGLVPA